MTTDALGLSLLQARDYLNRMKRQGFITHWQIETGDGFRGLFGVRVSQSRPGKGLFDQRVSATHYGRDLYSAAMRAVTDVRGSEK